MELDISFHGEPLRNGQQMSPERASSPPKVGIKGGALGGLFTLIASDPDPPGEEWRQTGAWPAVLARALYCCRPLPLGCLGIIGSQLAEELLAVVLVQLLRHVAQGRCHEWLAGLLVCCHSFLLDAS